MILRGYPEGSGEGDQIVGYHYHSLALSANAYVTNGDEWRRWRTDVNSVAMQLRGRDKSIRIYSVDAGANPIGTGEFGGWTLEIFVDLANNIIRPGSDDTFDLGSLSYRWRSGYFSQVGVFGGSDTYGISSGVVAGWEGGGMHLIVNDVDGARWGLATGGYDLTFYKHKSDTDTWEEALRLEGDAATNAPLGITVSGFVRPKSDNSYDLGSSSYRWRDLYLYGILRILGTTGYKDIRIGESESTGLCGIVKWDVTNDIFGIYTWDDAAPIRIGGSQVQFMTEGGNPVTLYIGAMDVNLYRSAADVLKTDDNFDALALRIGGTEVISSSREIYNITALALQDNELRLRTLTDGYHRIGYDSSRAGLSDVDFWKFNAALLFEGGTAPNYVMHLDGTNSRVGINKLNPTCTLDVNGDAFINGDALISGHMFDLVKGFHHNLVPNPSFEWDDVGSTVISGWIRESGSPRIEWHDRNDTLGRKCLYLPGDGTYHRVRSSYKIPVQRAGQVIYGRVYVKAPTGAKFYFGLKWDTGHWDYFKAGVSGYDTWTKITGTVTVPGDVISECESLADWSGTSLSLSADRVFDSYSIRDDITSPTAGTDYATTYNPAGSWNFSIGGRKLSFWIKCDRPSTDFNYCRVYIYDTAGNWRYKNISFNANEWTRISWDVRFGDGESATPPDITAIDSISFVFNATDTTSFYKQIDHIMLNEPTGFWVWLFNYANNTAPVWVDDVFVSVTELNVYNLIADGYGDLGSLRIGGTEVITSGRVLKNIVSVAQTLLPSSDNSYDLGSSDYRWRNEYLRGILEIVSDAGTRAIRIKDTAGTQVLFFGVHSSGDGWIDTDKAIQVWLGGGNINEAGNVIPLSDNTYNLGSSSLGWKNLCLRGRIYFGYGQWNDWSIHAYNDGLETLEIREPEDGDKLYIKIRDDDGIYFGFPLRPTTDGSIDLGSSSYGWRDLHIKRDVYLYGLPEVTPTE